jgi:hypothetical protein
MCASIHRARSSTAGEGGAGRSRLGLGSTAASRAASRAVSAEAGFPNHRSAAAATPYVESPNSATFR